MCKHDEERWRAIPGTDGRYEVSDKGRVRGVHTFLRLQLTSDKSYYKVRIKPRLASTEIIECLVHRLVAEAFVKKASPELKRVRFKDGNSRNLNSENLEWIK